VVGLIQEISEQTNLLALNAAMKLPRRGAWPRIRGGGPARFAAWLKHTKGATEEIAEPIPQHSR